MIDKYKHLRTSIHTCYMCNYRDKEEHELPCFLCTEINRKKPSLWKPRKNFCLTCEYLQNSIYEGTCTDCNPYKNTWECASIYKEYS